MNLSDSEKLFKYIKYSQLEKAEDLIKNNPNILLKKNGQGNLPLHVSTSSSQKYLKYGYDNTALQYQNLTHKIVNTMKDKLKVNPFTFKNSKGEIVGDRFNENQDGGDCPFSDDYKQRGGEDDDNSSFDSDVLDGGEDNNSDFDNSDFDDSSINSDVLDGGNYFSRGGAEDDEEYDIEDDEDDEDDEDEDEDDKDDDEDDNEDKSEFDLEGGHCGCVDRCTCNMSGGRKLSSRDKLLAELGLGLTSHRMSRTKRSSKKKARKVSKKARKVSKKARKVSKKARKVSKKARKVSKKTRKVSKKARKVSKKARMSRTTNKKTNKNLEKYRELLKKIVEKKKISLKEAMKLLKKLELEHYKSNNLKKENLSSDEKHTIRENIVKKILGN